MIGARSSSAAYKKASADSKLLILNCPTAYFSFFALSSISFIDTNVNLFAPRLRKIRSLFRLVVSQNALIQP